MLYKHATYLRTYVHQNAICKLIYLSSFIYRYSPGASSFAITVGGTELRDNLYLRLFDGTNYGRCVDIFAPGQDIQSAGIRSNDDVVYMSGTSQATPLVSGAAAIYWNMNRNATPLEIKDTIISTCTHNKLVISAEVLADQTPNCLLFIKSKLSFDKYYVFHAVPSLEVKPYIEDMKENSYALTYIGSYPFNSSVHYSLIFKYMADVEFVTIISPRLRQIQRSVTSYEEDGYQLTLIYYMMNSIDHIAVLEKTNLTYSHEYGLTERSHKKIYLAKSTQGDPLLSTVVRLTRKEKLRITSIYGQFNVTTHHFFNVRISRLLRLLDTRFNQRFYLTHLTTIPTNPARYIAVFQKMAKPITNYIMSKDLEFNQVDKFVKMQISKGFIPLVVTGLNAQNGLKFVTSFKK